MKCPRCGEDFNEEYSELEVHFTTDEKWLTRQLSMHAGPQYDYRDRVHLCPDCVAAFRRWWLEGERNV